MQYIFLFISTLTAYFVKGITGFGNTLVMGSLFSLAISNKLTTPIDLLFSLPTNAYMVWRERKSISLRIVIPLSLMLLAGIIPGTLLLKAGNDWVLRTVLGIIIVGLAFEMMFRKQKPDMPAKSNPLFLTVIGVGSGILTGLYGIGALLVAYISRTTDGKSQFRANICCVFLVENIFRLFLYLKTGLFSREVLQLALLFLPAVAIGMYIGQKVDTGMKEKTVKSTVIWLLMASGIVLSVKSAFLH